MLVYRLLRVRFLFGECGRGRGVQGMIFFYTCLRETLGRRMARGRQGWNGSQRL